MPSGHLRLHSCQTGPWFPLSRLLLPHCTSTTQLLYQNPRCHPRFFSSHHLHIIPSASSVDSISIHATLSTPPSSLNLHHLLIGPLLPSWIPTSHSPLSSLSFSSLLSVNRILYFPTYSHSVVPHHTWNKAQVPCPCKTIAT